MRSPDDWRRREKLSRFDPDMRLSNLKDRIGIFRRPEDYAKYADALRRAGLPE